MSARPIYYDTETTGIKAEKDRIVEIAAYDPERDKTFEKLINPKCPIPEEASRVHKITDEMVKDAPGFEEIIDPFIEFCEGDVVLIAHNNDSFDIHFLKKEFARCEREFPDWKFLDTLKWARRYRPDLPKHPLQFLRDIYGVEANNAHRALDDVIVLHKIFSQMLDDLTIDQAYALLNQKKALKTMPFGKHQGSPLNKVPKDYIRWLSDNGALDKAENLDLKEKFAELGLITV